MSVKFRGKKLSALVLDFDGTLYFSDEKLEAKIWGDVRRKLIEKIFEVKNITNDEANVFDQYLQSLIERAKEIGWKSSFLELGGNEDDFVEIISSAPIADHLSYNEELVTFLNELMKYIPVYIFTGSNRKRVSDALEVLIGNLWQEFINERLLAADDMKRGLKPDEDAYQEMITRFEIDPESTIFVDDQDVEVDTAARLGLKTFLIKKGGVEETLVGPHTIINSVLELSKHLIIKEK